MKHSFIELADKILFSSNNNSLYQSLKDADNGNFDKLIESLVQNYEDFFKIEKNNQDLYNSLLSQLPNHLRLAWVSYKDKYSIEQQTGEERASDQLRKLMDRFEYEQ